MEDFSGKNMYIKLPIFETDDSNYPNTRHPDSSEYPTAGVSRFYMVGLITCMLPYVVPMIRPPL